MSSGRRRALPYFLLAPGVIWLDPLLRRPDVLHGAALARVRESSPNFEFTWHWANFPTPEGLRHPVPPLLLLRRVATCSPADRLSAGLRDRLQGGAWRNAMLFAVVAPFFTTYLIRTLAWKTILADQSPVVSVLDTLGLTSERPRPRHQRRGDRRSHLQLPAVHGPADLRQPRAHRREVDRGRPGPLHLATQAFRR